MRTAKTRHPAVDVQVVRHQQLPGADDYAREKITSLLHLAPAPVLFARVRLTKHPDPSVARPVVAQANLDVNGRLVRAQVAGATPREAIDRLEATLRHRLERIAEHWENRRGRMPSTAPHEWRHGTEPAQRPGYFPRPADEREIIRHKTYALSHATIDEAAADLELMDYDFHLFTETATGKDSVLYHDGAAGFRLAQITPSQQTALAPHRVPVSISPQPAPVLSTAEAITRLALTDLPFVFFLDAERGRGSVLYHRIDGHYGLITSADQQ